jgi:hypothetical protein
MNRSSIALTLGLLVSPALAAACGYYPYLPTAGRMHHLLRGARWAKKNER